MSKLADDFLSFLRKKREEIGKNEFTTPDYMGFNGWQQARYELRDAGLIEWDGNVVGLIKLLDE